MTVLPEFVKDEDWVSRWIDSPTSYENDNFVPFKFDSKRNEADSVNWSKYLHKTPDIHLAGRKRIRELNKTKKNPSVYQGYIKCNVSDIRQISEIHENLEVSVNIFHHPSEGIAHCHIQLVKNLPELKTPRGIKSNIKIKLLEIFSPLIAY